MKVLDREIKIARPKRLRRPSTLSLFSAPAAQTPTPAVNQTVFTALLIGIPQSPEMALAHSKKLPSLNTTQPLRPMRNDRIQYPGRLNLRQHAIPRSKKPDKSPAT